MSRIFTFLLLFFFASFVCFAQKKVKKQKPSQPQFEDVIYNKEFTIGLKAHTNGFGLSANFVKINSIFKKRVIEIEIMDLKHPKEKRQQSLFSSGRTSAKGYVFGKQNNFYNVNANLGWVRTIAEKGRKSGVAVSMYYAGGISIGLAKPYYLDLIYDRSGEFEIRSEKYTPGPEPEGNADLYLNPIYIFGSSGFAAGLNELKIHPGLQGKVALNFDWANYSEFVKALEVGAMVNTYFQRIPILVDDDVKNHFIYVNLYLRLMLGKRW